MCKAAHNYITTQTHEFYLDIFRIDIILVLPASYEKRNSACAYPLKSAESEVLNATTERIIRHLAVSYSILYS